MSIDGYIRNWASLILERMRLDEGKFVPDMSFKAGMDVSDASIVEGADVGTELYSLKLKGNQTVLGFKGILEGIPIFNGLDENEVDVGVFSNGYVSVNGTVHYTRIYDIAKILVTQNSKMTGIPTKMMYECLQRNYVDVGRNNEQFYLREWEEVDEGFGDMKLYPTEPSDITVDSIAADMDRFWNRSKHGLERQGRKRIYDQMFDFNKGRYELLSLFSTPAKNMAGFSYIAETSNGLQVVVSPNVMNRNMDVQVQSLYPVYLFDLVKVYGDERNYKLLRGSRSNLPMLLVTKALRNQMMGLGKVYGP